MMKLYREAQLLMSDLEVANTFYKRLRGMIRRPISALYIPRCNSIHTYFMHKPIDVLFLDKNGEILFISRNVRSRRLRMCRRAAHVLELDAHMAEQLELLEGQQLRIEK